MRNYLVEGVSGTGKTSVATPATYFCGGSRNVTRLIDLFDEVFVLEVDRDTLVRRLSARAPDEFGGSDGQRALVLRLHASREDVPATGIAVDATQPLTDVVDQILRLG